MRDRTLLIISLLTLVGMVGLYIGLWKAYQLYQDKSAQLHTGTLGSVLTALNLN